MRKWLFGIVATAVVAAMVTEVAARPRAHKAIFNKKSCAEMLTRGGLVDLALKPKRAIRG